MHVNDREYKNYLESIDETNKLALEYVQIIGSQNTVSIKETIRKIQEMPFNNPIMDLNIKENHLRIKTDTSHSRVYYSNNHYLINFSNKTVSILNVDRNIIKNLKDEIFNRNDLTLLETEIKDDNGILVPALTIGFK